MRCVGYTVLLTVIVIATAHSAAAPLYRLTPIADGGQARDINQFGQVTGSKSGPHAYLWSTESGYQDLGTLPGATVSSGQSLNNIGQVVGFGYVEPGISGAFHAILASTTGMMDLGTLPGYTFGRATSINDHSQIVGVSSNTNFSRGRAFLWNNGSGMEDLGALPGMLYSTATGISNAGQVVGSSGSSTLATNDRGFLWTRSSGMQDLGALPDATFAPAIAINEVGQVVGTSGNDHWTHAYLWSTATGLMTDLGTLGGDYTFSSAFGLNNVGDVVGYGHTSLPNTNIALLWTKSGEIYNLEDLLDASGAGWKLGQAFAINDSGQIVGVGISPTTHMAQGFLLTLVPEPSAFVLAVVGVVSLFAVRRSIASGR